MGNNRFKTAKRREKKTGTRRARPLVQAKRREVFYTTGKGSVGVLVRKPRIVRIIRKVRKDENERFQRLTGIVTKGKKQVLYKGFVNVTVGALDASANQIMEIAAQFAKKRSKNGAKGMKLRIEDLTSAIWVIRKLAAHQ